MRRIFCQKVSKYPRILSKLRTGSSLLTEQTCRTFITGIFDVPSGLPAKFHLMNWYGVVGGGRGQGSTAIKMSDMDDDVYDEEEDYDLVSQGPL